MWLFICVSIVCKSICLVVLSIQRVNSFHSDGFFIHIDTISIDVSILYLKMSQVKISKFFMFLSMKIVFVFANSTDQDEMLHYAAFYLGLHCLPKYLFTDIQDEMD